MAQRKNVENSIGQDGEPEGFLRRRGIFPANGNFTQEQLARELTRRGWRWQIDHGRVKATKAYTPSGTVSWNFESDDADRVAAFRSVLVDAIKFDEEHGLGLARPMKADVVIRAPDQRVIGIVEARAIEGLSDSVASEYRGNLVSSSSGYALAPFLLIVLPDFGYFWDQRSGALPYSSPTRKFSMAPLIARYLPWLEPGERPGGGELAQVVAIWLDDLANPIPHRSVPAEEVFAGTEFVDAIRGATILTDAAA